MKADRFLFGAAAVWGAFIGAEATGQQPVGPPTARGNSAVMIPGAVGSVAQARRRALAPARALSASPAPAAMNPAYPGRVVSSSVEQSHEAVHDDVQKASQPLEFVRPYGRRGQRIPSNVDQSGEGDNASQSYVDVQLDRAPADYGGPRRHAHASVEQSADGISASQLNAIQPLEGGATYGRRRRGP